MDENEPVILTSFVRQDVERVIMGLYESALQAAIMGRQVDRLLVMTACEELASKLQMSVSSVIKAIRDRNARPRRSDQRQLGA